MGPSRSDGLNKGPGTLAQHRGAAPVKSGSRLIQAGAPTRSSKARFLRVVEKPSLVPVAPRALLAPPAKPPTPKAPLPKPVPRQIEVEIKRALLVPRKTPPPADKPSAPPRPIVLPSWLQKALASVPPPPAIPLPEDVPMLTNADREKLFGRFTFKATPTLSDPERVFVDPAWIAKNISARKIASISSISGVPYRGIELHKLVLPHFETLVAAWAKEGLLPLILTWNGGFVPRFRRGQADKKVLSAHSWGSAFDINARWNPFRKKPAPLNTEGCVIKLVTVAKKLGWVWGGDWQSPDGMHFEAGAELLGLAPSISQDDTLDVRAEKPEEGPPSAA
jgi:hypothetical protein